MLPEPNGLPHAPHNEPRRVETARETEAASLAQFELRLRDAIGPRRHQSWFVGKARFALSGDELTVYAASPYLASWLQRQFQPQVREAAERALGAGIRVQWAVDAALSAPGVVAGPESPTAHASPVDAAESSAHRATPGRSEGIHLRGTAAARPSGAAGGGAPASPPRRVYDLDAFVVGPCNEMATLAARQVAEAPGQRLNPLYLYGGVGLGKTHLLEAIGHEIRRHAPALRVVSMTAESFVNCYTQAIETRTLASFRQKFRSMDVLLLDDIDFFDGRGGLQDEFLHTLKKLEEFGKQLVVTGDRHPRLLTKTSEELVTRFQAGLVARLEAPDLETRRTIVRRLAESLEFPVADEALEFVAARFRGNVRELEGAMNCLHTWHLMTGRRVLQSTAREVLARLERDCLKVVRMADVESAVCEFFGVAADDLRSDNRARTLVQPRMLAMYLSRRLTRSAYSEIGSYFGGRKHTTAIAAEKKIGEQVLASESIRIGHETWKLGDLVETLSRQIQSA